MVRVGTVDARQLDIGMNNKTTVVIPNYNGIKYIEGCMDSLEKQNFKEFETIVIDNASQDGSDNIIEDKYPWAKLVRNSENTGFSRAVNQGIELSETEYVILLNNDTEVHPDYVGELVKAIDEDEKIFSVSSKMISFKDRDLMDDAGDLYTLFGWSAQRGVAQSIEKYNKKKNVFTACAGAAIYRKKIFDEIGVFDVKHFAYLEDLDVGYRARIQGYRNVFCPTAIVWHIGSATSGSRYNDFKVSISARNNVYLIYKNMPLFQVIFNICPLALGTLVKYLTFVKWGFGDSYKRGLKEGLKTKKECKKVKFRWKNFGHYCKIQLELTANTFIYVADYFRRAAVKRKLKNGN